MSDDIRVTVRLFASLRDAARADRVELVLPRGTPVGAVWGHLPEPVREVGLPDAARYALNHQWTIPGALLRDGDEVALVLPVSGRMIVLTGESLDTAALVAAVADPDHGGTATFVGTTRREGGDREVRELRYEAYEELAVIELEAICAEARARFRARVAVAHRVGAVAVGEPSVAVAASAGHRPAAFAACRYLIDELKARAPIWKQTVYADGETSWVDGCAVPHPAHADSR